MSNGIIIYKSKYGASKKYAQWLAESCCYDIVEINKANIKNIQKYNNIVFCGAIYASGIRVLKFLKKHYSDLSKKNIAVFCIGASPFDEKSFNAIKAHNISKELENIPLFYGRGIWDEEKMKFIDHTLCKMLQKVVSKKNPNDYEPWEYALMSAIGQSCDWTDKNYLNPLLELLKQW